MDVLDDAGVGVVLRVEVAVPDVSVASVHEDAAARAPHEFVPVRALDVIVTVVALCAVTLNHATSTFR